MHSDPIVEEVHRVRQELLGEFGGDVDPLMDEADRKLLSGEFGEFKVVARSPGSACAARDRDAGVGRPGLRPGRS